MKCLYLAAHWPDARLSAAGRRTLDLLDALREHFDAEVHIGCHADLSTESGDWLRQRGETLHPIELNRCSFDAWVRDLAPQMVIFDRFMTEEQFGWRVASQLPQALRVLDMQDFHALRYARAAGIKANQRVGVGDLLAEPLLERELAAFIRSDVVLVISQVELKLLESLLMEQGLSEVTDRLCYFPFVHQHAEPYQDKASQPRRSFDERQQRLVFVGNFLHEPNWDAVRWLRQSIWPRVHAALPGLECHIYGAFTTAKVQQLQNASLNFWVKGAVDDIDSEVRSALLNLAPLRFGAGLKGKVFDAALLGTPSIMTSVAAEGLFEQSSEVGVVDLPDGFANEVIKAASESQYWQQLQASQRGEILTQFYGKSHGLRLADKLKAKMEHSRQMTLLQKMFYKESLRANQYFSRWIELKESN